MFVTCDLVAVGDRVVEELAVFACELGDVQRYI